jgi:hypothetical protein
LIEKRDHVSSDSKTIAPVGHLRDLTLIQNDLKALLDDHAGSKDRQLILNAWQAQFVRFEN